MNYKQKIEKERYLLLLIPLEEKVVGVLNVTLGTVAKLVGHEVVVHVVGSKGEKRLP